MSPEQFAHHLPDRVSLTARSNAAAESFWSSLKRELVHRYQFPDRASARQAIFAWINRYNRLRLHSSLSYLPPLEWENQYRQPKADQAA